MNKGSLPWAATAAIAAGFGLLIAFGATWGSIALIAIVATIAYGAIGSAMRSQADQDWLARWVLVGFLAKLGGTWARHYTVTIFYEGGDAFSYFSAGTELAAAIRSGTIPDVFQGGGSFGTQMMELITGGVFSIYTPDLLGAFLIFSILAFGGQLMFYAAFRRWANPNQLKLYALAIFFLPTFVFWPSSLGKDAVVIFALGGAAYFTSRILDGFETRWLLGLGMFLGLLGLIRIHVAGLVVIGLIAAGLIARMPDHVRPGAAVRRLLIIGAFVAAGGVVLVVFPDIFGVEITGEESLDEFTSDIVRRTTERGTVAPGGPVTSPLDIPEAVALVLFRPYLFEATAVQHRFAAAETTLLLGLTLWKLPTIIRNRRQWRANGYVVFSTAYVLAYAIAFSIVRQLGIIARQRGQVLALFLVVVIALGWESRDAVAQDPTGESPNELDDHTSSMTHGLSTGANLT